MTPENLYIFFRQAQGSFLNRPYRLPKDVTNYIEVKLTKVNNEKLKTASLWFNTKWQNVDPEKYLKCGFEIFGKSFSYTKFFDEKIIKLYITKDRNEKINTNTTKKELLANISFIFAYMKDKTINKNYGFFENYCKQRDGVKKVVIEHYLKNNISSLLFIYFLNKKYIILTDEEKTYLPYLISQQRELKVKALEFQNLLDKVESNLNERI